jgi:hypothetical protein
MTNWSAVEFCVHVESVCRQFDTSGHEVTALTAGHGLLPEVRRMS